MKSFMELPGHNQFILSAELQEDGKKIEGILMQCVEQKQISDAFSSSTLAQEARG